MRTIAIHTQHDACLAIAEDRQVILVLELERLFGVRHFECSTNLEEFRREWSAVLAALPPGLLAAGFEVGITSWVPHSQRAVLHQLIPARVWTTVDHHDAHAALGYQDSPFERALVLSYDGGGNDGTFNTFTADPARLSDKRWIPLNLGTPYRSLATAMPEVTGGRPQPAAGSLPLSGKLMGYAAYGEVRSAWLPAMKEYFQRYQYPRQALFTLGEQLGLCLEPDALGPAKARDLAATGQRVFGDLLLEIVTEELKVRGPVDGVVLTGGAALNVCANQRLREELGLKVHVPSAPNDGGIAAGALWAHTPAVERHPITYLGLELQDDVGLEQLAAQLGAQRASLSGLAERLARGQVVGVARGRAEVGPRALGNRSILCVPRDPGMRERLNARVKFREWYRPFAPVVPLEQVERFFIAAGPAPYMSFAPRWQPGVEERFPAVRHVDGTARVQTVSPSDHPWLHALLIEVEALTGDCLLLNTSFNTRGRPLVSRASEALDMLQTTDLDAALVGDWLFERR